MVVPFKKNLKDVLSENPVLEAEFSEKNTPETLDLLSGSNKKVWWFCQKYGCHYQMQVNKKVKSPTSCSVCNGSQVFPGFNDLATVLPHVASEWDYGQNPVGPSEVKFSSSRKFAFICSQCEHRWVAPLAERARGGGCSRCSHRVQKSGVERVLSVDDEMKAYFKGEGNPARSSGVVVSWECREGHRWEKAPRYFKGCPMCSQGALSGGNRDFVAPAKNPLSSEPSLMALYAPGNVLPASHVSVASGRVCWFVCPQGHSWEAPVYSVKKSVEQGFTGCLHCSYQVSRGEREVGDWVREMMGENEPIIFNDRKTITPQELDILLPNHNIAIEYNGTYWHQENKVGKNYHAQKHQACQQQGIQLITIWEDDWKNRQHIIKNALQHKLKASTQEKISARKTTLSTLNAQETRNFCTQNHLQGYTPGSLYLALKNQETPIAVSIWRKNKNTLYLERYCTSKIVPGGLGKLLKQAATWGKQQGCTEIVTFSDKTISDGGIYKKLGFTEDKHLPPDYSYIVNGQRKHKANYRISRFKKDPNLLFKEGLTETELAQLNQLPRVYDAGKIRWKLAL